MICFRMRGLVEKQEVDLIDNLYLEKQLILKGSPPRRGIKLTCRGQLPCYRGGVQSQRELRELGSLPTAGPIRESPNLRRVSVMPLVRCVGDRVAKA